MLNPAGRPAPGDVDVEQLVETPPENMRVPVEEWSPRVRLPRLDFVARDAANRDLGRRGEEFVLEFERRRVHESGHPDLVWRIEWTAQVMGDGAGYDIESFSPDRSPRLVEVKTTGLGKHFPFNVTANEVRCSEARPRQFHLYRVFNFGPEARLYMLPGSIAESCRLNATQYRAFVNTSVSGDNFA